MESRPNIRICKCGISESMQPLIHRGAQFFFNLVTSLVLSYSPGASPQCTASVDQVTGEVLGFSKRVGAPQQEHQLNI